MLVQMFGHAIRFLVCTKRACVRKASPNQLLMRCLDGMGEAIVEGGESTCSERTCVPSRTLAMQTRVQLNLLVRSGRLQSVEPGRGLVETLAALRSQRARCTSDRLRKPMPRWPWRAITSPEVPITVCPRRSRTTPSSPPARRPRRRPHHAAQLRAEQPDGIDELNCDLRQNVEII